MRRGPPAASGAGGLKTQGVADELRFLFRLACPSVCVNLLTSLLAPVGQVYAGRLGVEALAAAALGNALFQTVWCFLLGVSTALDTLASQAYGAGDTELVRLWSWRCALVMAGLLVPGSALMYRSCDIMVRVGLPEDLSAEAGVFVDWLIPGTWFWAWLLCVMKYQQAQNVMWPSVLVAAAVNVVNVGASKLAVDTWGLAGSAMGTSLARLLMLGGLLLYVRSAPEPSGASESLPGCSEAYSGGRAQPGWAGACLSVMEPGPLLAMIRLALCGGLMMGMEGWTWEFMTILAGYRDRLELDAHNILLCNAMVTWMSIPNAIAIAGTIRVGNLIGARDGARARRAGVLSIVLGMTVTLATVLATCAWRGRWVALFTADARILELTAHLMRIVAPAMLLDAFQTLCGGVLRGLGRQATVAKLNMVCYWVVCCPCMVALCFRADWGVVGIWAGLVLGLVVMASAYVCWLAGIDWQEEAARGGQAWSAPLASPLMAGACTGQPAPGVLSPSGRPSRQTAAAGGA